MRHTFVNGSFERFGNRCGWRLDFGSRRFGIAGIAAAGFVLRSLAAVSRQAEESACRTRREQLGFVRDLFTPSCDCPPQPHIDGESRRAGWRKTMLTKKQSELLRFIHERLQDVGRAAVLRRNEGGAGSALEIRNSSTDHGARGAGFHPPARQSRPGDRSPAAPRVGDGLGPEGAAVFAERHPRQSRPPPASGAVARPRRAPRGHGAAHGPHRRRHPDLRHPDAARDLRHAAGISRRRRALRPRGARQLR